MADGDRSEAVRRAWETRKGGAPAAQEKKLGEIRNTGATIKSEKASDASTKAIDSHAAFSASTNQNFQKSKWESAVKPSDAHKGAAEAHQAAAAAHEKAGNSDAAARHQVQANFHAAAADVKGSKKEASAAAEKASGAAKQSGSASDHRNAAAAHLAASEAHEGPKKQEHLDAAKSHMQQAAKQSAAQAMKAGATAKESDSAGDHKKAAEAHRLAAFDAGMSGDKKSADEHHLRAKGSDLRVSQASSKKPEAKKSEAAPNPKVKPTKELPQLQRAKPAARPSPQQQFARLNLK
jgi:hypothetical protein